MDNVYALTELVRAAQRGDPDAFGQIVTRFQNMACAVCYTMIGDSAAAQDAAQEAFIEAYLCLHTLRDPAAFAGWFRRILIKRCERQYRLSRADVSLDEEGLAGSAAGEQADPSLQNDERTFRRSVRQAIAALPNRLRLVTALFYLYDFSQQEIVDSLGLPVTTIKKRLFDARKKLRSAIAEMPEVADMISTPTPKEMHAFNSKVLFFVALKTHNRAQVQQLLDESPELINAVFEWGVASEGYFWPLGYTTMHWAAATNDRALLETLLSRGGNVNTLAPLDGQTPLHAAALLGRPEMAARLLEAGADIDTQDSNGHTALHLAAWANQPAVASVLLERGAQADLKDGGGRTVADWAVVKNAPAILDALARRGVPKPADWPAPPIKPDRGTLVFETGLKIIDLCAPLKRGGYNALFTPYSGVGKMVTVNHLIQVVSTHYGGHTIWLGLEHGLSAREGLELSERSAGLAGVITFVFARQDEPASYRIAAYSAIQEAEREAARGRDVLLVVASPVALAEGVQLVLESAAHDAGPATRGSVTLLYYGDQTVGAEPEALANLDAAVAFDHWRGKQGLWPTIDVLNSRSKLLATGDAGERHVRLARQTHRLLRRYQDLVSIPDEEPRGMDGLPLTDDSLLLKRARLMHVFLSQPVPQVELYTHRPAEYVPLRRTLDVCEAILAGRLDQVSESELLYAPGTERDTEGYEGLYKD